jgi:formate-dependent nitrite reductase membrane component NrfD
MQACPYDALYINPFTNTAEKCNYCAHRVDVGLEPSCVIVCPVEAIVAGDLDDPTATISRLLASEQTQVRKPEARTLPKLHYIEVESTALRPAEQTRAAGYLWAEQSQDPLLQDDQAFAEADARARTTYDVSHERPWGWKVSAYLWTKKSIAAGAFLLTALGTGLGLVRHNWLFETVAPQVALFFLVVTLALLIADLKRPERFLSILLRPQWRSWLVIGGYVLAGYGGILAIWMALPFLGLRTLETPALLLGGALAVMTAIYSAFLFRQCRGRVFWHSPLTPLHLLVQSLVAGAASLMLAATLNSMLTGAWLVEAGFQVLYYELVGALIAHGVLIAGELLMPEENVERARAIRLITRGLFQKWFWGGAVGAGIVLPLLGLATGFAEQEIGAVLTTLLALGGVLVWEHIWVQAGQAVPLS